MGPGLGIRRPRGDPLALLGSIKDTSAKKPISISTWAKLADINRTTLNDYVRTYHSKGWVATAGEGNTARQYITEKGLEAIRLLEEKE